MKYRFKPQTCLLVAGLLAATYSEACYYQNTSVLCVTSGSTVSTWTWNINPYNQATVTATQDWYVYDTSHHLVYVGSGNSGNTRIINSSGAANSGDCHGAASFKDVSNHTVSVPDWSYGSVGSGSGVATWYYGASTSGGTCS